MTMHARYQTIGQIKSTNPLQFAVDDDAVEVVDELLKSHKVGAPVTDGRGACVGFINETILLDAIMNGKNLKGLTARDVMDRPHTITENATIEAAIRLMDEWRLQQLPVVRNGRLVATITRHDLLRALLDLGLGVEQ